MEAITCYKCGVVFGVPEHWVKCRREDKESFWCPNGHSQAFVKSETDKLRLERDQLKQRLAMKDDEIARQRSMRETAERQVSAARGQVTKLKKRAKGGVCPCCNRQFADMARHMETKHPDFDPKVADFETEKAKRA